MKIVRNIILAGALLAVALQAVAQNQKIGFIDSDLIMDRMPEYSGIEQRLSLLAENWENEIDRMQQDLSELREEFEAREILFTDEIREERLREIRQLESQIDDYTEEKFGPDGEYFERQKELLEPIQRLIFDALNRVASRDDFDFVFDRAADTRFLFVNEEWNLTDEVMVELGIDETGN
ncbi:MAG: OmpH family outer membrane protein [Bacteroidetes bacterium]|jgi:outer membrane protein|nr:OmpH family outer membrane protein [Bacteroidota bacterium]